MGRSHSPSEGLADPLELNQTQVPKKANAFPLMYGKDCAELRHSKITTHTEQDGL